MHELKRVFNKYFLTALVALIIVAYFIMPMFGIDLGEWSEATRFTIGFIYGSIAYIWSEWMMNKERRQKDSS